MNLNDFYNGNEWNAHEYFGAHIEGEGVRFRVYAPKARRVTVIGEFNFWHDTEMSNEGRGGIYSVCIPEAKEGQMYKYRVYHQDGSCTDKADPYGFGMELRPCSASIIRRRDSFLFTDEEWMRNTDKGYNSPMNIYEIHFGSWRRKKIYNRGIRIYNDENHRNDCSLHNAYKSMDDKEADNSYTSLHNVSDAGYNIKLSNGYTGLHNAYKDETESSFGIIGERWYNYDELAEVLIPYLKEMGYTHVELLPLFEHPLDESWGYQATGFFAPTSRYGSCDGLKSFVNTCHNAGIGVILDFVMVHFATDDYGLKYFDGSELYEVPRKDKSEGDDYMMSEWGSYNFFHARGEVASFLKSCADYWITDYHMDGLRFDAISNIIYRQGRQELGINEKALEFVRSLNGGIKMRHPHVILFAEDSTTYLKVTAPVEYGGLGFDYKWDLGFMHDTLDFFSYPPEERKNHYAQILFSMHYFYNELYLLAFSHDEVVHGKKTLIDKMYGSYEEKFAQCRAMFLYWYAHPGKKLSFMGNEIAQFREWGEYREQDFDVLAGFPMHRMFSRFARDVSLTYDSHRALYEGEYNRHCFRYIIEDRRDDLVYAFERNAGGERILAVFNFGDKNFERYEIKIPGNHLLKELINSDADIYGGTDNENMETVYVRNGRCAVKLPSYTGRLFMVE